MYVKCLTCHNECLLYFQQLHFINKNIKERDCLFPETITAEAQTCSKTQICSYVSVFGVRLRKENTLWECKSLKVTFSRVYYENINSLSQAQLSNQETGS